MCPLKLISIQDNVQYDYLILKNEKDQGICQFDLTFKTISNRFESERLEWYNSLFFQLKQLFLSQIIIKRATFTVNGCHICLAKRKQ